MRGGSRRLAGSSPARHASCAAHASHLCSRFHEAGGDAFCLPIVIVWPHVERQALQLSKGALDARRQAFFHCQLAQPGRQRRAGAQLALGCEQGQALHGRQDGAGQLGLGGSSGRVAAAVARRHQRMHSRFASPHAFSTSTVAPVTRGRRGSQHAPTHDNRLSWKGCSASASTAERARLRKRSRSLREGLADRSAKGQGQRSHSGPAPREGVQQALQPGAHLGPPSSTCRRWPPAAS